MAEESGKPRKRMVIVSGKSDSVDVTLGEGMVTSVLLPCTMINPSAYSKRLKDIRVKDYVDYVDLIPMKPHKPGHLGNIQVKCRDLQLSLNVIMAETSAEAYDIVEIRRPDQAAERVASLETQLVTERTEREQRHQLATANHAIYGRTYLPVMESKNDGPVKLTGHPSTWLGEKFYMGVGLGNDELRPHSVDRVELRDERGKSMGEARITFQPDDDHDVDDRVVPAGGKRRGTIELEAVPDAQIAPMTILLYGPDDLLLATGKVIRFKDLKEGQVLMPVSEEEEAERERERAERERERAERERERAERERERENVSKKTLSLLGIYGVTWLSDGQKLPSTDATDIKGFGMRLGRGMTEHIDFEIDLGYAQTGNAEFEDLMLDSGMQGDLTRTAWLLRLQGGIRVHFDGGWYRPFVRAGVGLQGARYSDELLINGVRTADKEFEFDPLFAIGAGVDVPLGPLAVGLALAGVFEFDGGGRAFVPGLHAGYSWK